MINTQIDTFIVKFQWSKASAAKNISLLSMVNPLGGLIGAFFGKTLVSFTYISLIDKLWKVQSNIDI